MIKNIDKKELKLIISMAGFIFLNILSVWFLWRQSIILAGILFILAVIEMRLIKSKKIVAVFIVSALGGVFIEIGAIYFGNWRYSSPDFLNIPFWLFPTWGNAGIIIASFYKLFSKIYFLENKNIER